MDHRTSLRALAPLVLVAAAIAPSSALAADDKEACLAAADQGQSLRDDGHYLVARDQFLTCARDVCPKLVHDQCTEWLRQLDEAMPTVVFAAKDPQGNDIPAARVLSDGKLVTGNLDGKPIALDPGPHDIRFERDPNESATVHVVLRTGEKNREVATTLAGGEPTSTPPEGPSPAPAPPPGEQPAAAPFWGPRAVVSLSLLVGAAAAVGVGAYFGVQSQNEKSTADGLVTTLKSDTACSANLAMNQSACDSLNSARDAQNNDAVLNEAFYIAGGALAVGAVAAWFLWPKPQEEVRASSAWLVPVLGPTGAGLRAGGTF
ncbi:MAG TPA: hypothetical protein VE987_09245 [Polyangiaceae bacterium]|nr:hypothetical protein [Polyangiaceae bacterium]